MHNPAVNKVTEHTTTAPGSVERQSVSVVVDAGGRRRAQHGRPRGARRRRRRHRRRPAATPSRWPGWPSTPRPPRPPRRRSPPPPPTRRRPSRPSSIQTGAIAGAVAARCVLILLISREAPLPQGPPRGARPGRAADRRPAPAAVRADRHRAGPARPPPPPRSDERRRPPGGDRRPGRGAARRGRRPAARLARRGRSEAMTVATVAPATSQHRGRRRPGPAAAPGHDPHRRPEGRRRAHAARPRARGQGHGPARRGGDRRDHRRDRPARAASTGSPPTACWRSSTRSRSRARTSSPAAAGPTRRSCSRRRSAPSAPPASWTASRRRWPASRSSSCSTPTPARCSRC